MNGSFFKWNASAQLNLQRTPTDEASPQDYKTAVKWYELAAEPPADAQFYLGHMYHYGHSVPADHKTAVNLWYRLAAEQGNAFAQLHGEHTVSNQRIGEQKTHPCDRCAEKEIEKLRRIAALEKRENPNPNRLRKDLNPRSPHLLHQVPLGPVSLSPNLVTSSPMNMWFVSAVQ